MNLHVVSVVGARPQFVKLAPIASSLLERGVRHSIIHTGQHYDTRMSDIFFDELQIPLPDVHLGVGSASHGAQTARILEKVEQHLLTIAPDWVLAYGDTNSTIATALAASKIHLPLAHLEAGLRSNNRRMPEEHNRVLTDHASDLLLCPSTTAMTNLAREGLRDRARFVGDVMVDITLRMQRELRADQPFEGRPRSRGTFVLATIHRAENTDDPVRLSGILSGLHRLECAVVLAVHPRLRARAEEFDIQLEGGSVILTDPLPYRSMIAAIDQAAAVVTDSGGLQKEAYVLQTPCTTVRTETEWLETLDHGWNRLVPDPEDLTDELILRDMARAPHATPYGDGHAADRVVATLLQETP